MAETLIKALQFDFTFQRSIMFTFAVVLTKSAE